MKRQRLGALRAHWDDPIWRCLTIVRISVVCVILISFIGVLVDASWAKWTLAAGVIANIVLVVLEIARGRVLTTRP